MRAPIIFHPPCPPQNVSFLAGELTEVLVCSANGSKMHQFRQSTHTKLGRQPLQTIQLHRFEWHTLNSHQKLLCVKNNSTSKTKVEVKRKTWNLRGEFRTLTLCRHKSYKHNFKSDALVALATVLQMLSMCIHSIRTKGSAFSGHCGVKSLS